ncbi:MAG: hypothetical protein HYR96_07780 [Deltaproteobacteria bacterium]|nr:hypothetical protein [Deltaproteobacteria bacterium]MBI3296379.1 hypothetical protein [Deltaproteobacteria bacterium]
MGKWIFHTIFLSTLAACDSSVSSHPHSGKLAILSIAGLSVYSFPGTSVGTATIHAFTVSNVGDLDASSMFAQFYVSAFSFTGGLYPGVNGSCGASLARGASCLIEVAFAPSYAGTFNDTIQIQYFNGASNHSTEYPQVFGAGN